MSKKVLIVGGVAGGATVAARLRRLDEDIEIVMFEKDEYISFANCGLPYHIGEVIKKRGNLLLQTPKAMKDRFELDVRIFSEVTKIDPANNQVTVSSKDRGVYEESYDYLVLSPGAAPMKPPIKGIDSKKVMSLRNIPDTDAIKAMTDSHLGGTAIVIGGGFIGIETAENMIERGLKVILVEAVPHILAPFDSELSMIAESEMESHGVQLHLGDGVSEFIEDGEKISVKLASGKIVTGDFVVSAIGVKPETAFLKDSGIEMGPRGHIIVDDHMRTNFPNVYAAGDAIEVVDFITGQKTAIPLAGPANRQGRIIADNIAGLDRVYKGTMGTSILKVFELTAAATGINERNAKRLGINHRAVFIHPNNHASYYPGATQMSIKLLFNDDRKVLGAQAMGYEGVDKLIDVIATTIKFGGTIDDLAELEQAYAPPFLSAKSPANMLGFVAQNTLDGLVDNRTVDDFNATFDRETMVLLDVREKIEVENGSLEGMMHIPLNSLRERMNEVPKDKLVWVYCQVGLRGYIASRILNQNGYETKNLSGGYKLINFMKFKPSDKDGGDKGPSGGVKEEMLTESGEVVMANAMHVVGTSALDNLKEVDADIENQIVDLDATGLCCPGPLMRVKSTMDSLNKGDTLNIVASDMGFYEDIRAWAKRTGNELVSVAKDKGLIRAQLKKGLAGTGASEEIVCSPGSAPYPVAAKDNKTMIVFSGELDKAIASFIIANGAASMGKKVTMFFTFWGINVLRKEEHVPVTKTFMEKAFGFMMPKGSKKLQLSNMNMGGMGAKLIRNLMKEKNVQSLEELIKAAMDSGVEVVACQMSMDLLGLKQEELLDGVKLGGVGYMLSESEDSNATLFI
jgi:NADPH-dependent 2,4-dienoyl-CoA reductase/sulfur reductase-like enzyme/peroxiredoxin family protein/TusA-related sulfurtransferase/rhodanese-related sulfurtransferase